MSEPEIMNEERERLHERPMDRSDNPRRTHPLKGSFAKITLASGEGPFPLWQREQTGAGRIWYAVDKRNRTVYITKVSLSHPKETE